MRDASLRTVAALVALAAAVATTSAPASGSAATQAAGGTERALCPFPLQVTVKGAGGAVVPTAVLHFRFAGPVVITVRNASTGRAARLESSGSNSVDTRTGSVTFRGHHVWYWSTGSQVPFLSTDGTGRLQAPSFVLSSGSSSAHVIDPCALVAPSPPSAKPRTTPAPWPLPAYVLSRIAFAGLTPLLGTVIRHDHVHLDVIVDGRKVTIPGGVGLAAPADEGPCPAIEGKNGDCATGHGLFARVANSPLHTHSSSGLVHIESDRPARYTLGQFFDEWGVRLDSHCVGGYCAGSGKELRVFVGGREHAGDPRGIVLRDHQEIAVVFGRTFESVPSSYTGGWPGAGCGGRGEKSCLP